MSRHSWSCYIVYSKNKRNNCTIIYGIADNETTAKETVARLQKEQEFLEGTLEGALGKPVNKGSHVMYYSYSKEINDFGNPFII